MSFFGFGKKKEAEQKAEPLPAPKSSSSMPPSVDPAALVSKKEDFPFEHINSSPLDMPQEKPPEAVQKVEIPMPEAPIPDFLDAAPGPMKEADLSELAKQLPLQDIPLPPKEEQPALEVPLDMSFDIPADFAKPLAKEETPEPSQEQTFVREELPAFNPQDFEELHSHTMNIETRPVSETPGQYQDPSDMGADLLGPEKKIRRFKVTKINGELYVEAESYKFFLENMVTMHEDLKRTNELFLSYSDENQQEDRLYKKMFQQLNSIHEDLIKIDHELFERESW